MTAKSGAVITFAVKNGKMKKNIVVHGLIAGVIVSFLMLLTMNYFSFCAGNVDYNTSMVIGYASMLLSFSLVFVGVRNYRDRYLGGAISFGKAFQVGILIVLVASTIYVATWLVYNYCFAPDFMEKMSAHMLNKLKASGASQAEIDKQTKEMADMVKMLKNPVYNGLIAYTEIIPMGLVVTLISALTLKKKAKQP